MPLTGFQQEVLTGLMLGDGHLSIGGKAKNPRLRINRTDRDMEYAEWIAEVFSPYITAKSLRRTTQFDPRYEKTYGTRRPMGVSPSAPADIPTSWMLTMRGTAVGRDVCHGPFASPPLLWPSGWLMTARSTKRCGEGSPAASS